MFRSISRLVVAFAFILALVLSAIPAQAQPRDFGTGFATFDGSWLEAALSWFDGLLGGESSIEALKAGGKGGSIGSPGDVSTMGGSCIDPYGGCGN